MVCIEGRGAARRGLRGWTLAGALVLAACPGEGGTTEESSSTAMTTSVTTTVDEQTETTAASTTTTGGSSTTTTTDGSTTTTDGPTMGETTADTGKTTGMTTDTGESSSGSSSSGETTDGTVCDPANCPQPSDECRVAACDDDGACTEEARPDNAVLAMQVDGDCQRRICIGGLVHEDPDNADEEDDGNMCTFDFCGSSGPEHEPQFDLPCFEPPFGHCDATGQCVGCNAPAQCPGQDNECQMRTCEAGMCGIAFVAAGTPTMGQTVGDCRENQCSGDGGIESVADVSDVEDDGNACTDDACNGDIPVHTPTAVQTPCGAGLKCDGMGMCVGCITAADCQAPGNQCLVATCAAGMCGTMTKPDGTGCSDGNACSQADTCQAGACSGANPVVCGVSDQCHLAGTCDPATGDCSNPARPDGSGCDDGSACTQTDTCQGGACSGASPLMCMPSDQCHEAGNCDPATGMCSNPAKPNGTACTVAAEPGICQQGACTVCGNGVVEGPEECDDMNATPCDGCSPKCQLDTSITYATGSGLNVGIPDDGYNGTQATMSCVNVPVTSAGDGVVDYMCPTVALAHTWVGDLTVKLVSPANTVVTLMSLPGVIEAADDGLSVTGDSSNLLAGFPLTWKDGGPKSAEQMGNGIGNGQVVCKDDFACVYDPNRGAAAPGKLSAFIGQPAGGTWRLCVGDGGSGDPGSIDQVKLVIGQ